MPPQATFSKKSRLAAQNRDRIDNQLRLLQAARPLLPRRPNPYFAHLRVAQDGQTLHVLIAGPGQDDDAWDSPLPRRGPEARTIHNEEGERILLVDWRQSPLASLFFSKNEGEHYQLRLPGRTISGTLLEKNLVRFEDGVLVEILAPYARLSRQSDGSWQGTQPRPLELEPRSREARDRPPSLIDVTLDPAQQAIVNEPPGRSLLLLGEAGHGKTTVALHRLVHLLRTSPRRLRAAVIVPTEGLRALLDLWLRQIRIEADVIVYDHFARRKARRAFADIPRRESEHANASVLRIKRDPALRTLLRTLAKRRPGRLDDDPEAPVRKSKAWARHADLQHLFGDSVLLERLRAASKDRITDNMVAEVLEHTHVQFSQCSEEEYAHVIDKERLVPVDHLSLDEGTPMQNAGTIDVEDYAVLFELDKQRAERKGQEPTKIPKPYDLIVIDEAQEFASLELSLIGRSLAPFGTLIVAGDADQQLDPAACFESWERTMLDLGCPDHDRAMLEVGYRSPPHIHALARSLRSGALTDTPADIEITSFESRFHLGAWLADELTNIEERDPKASIAILCRTPITATRLFRLLSQVVASRLVLDGRFVFRSGVTITSVDQVKGLEFDYVIVPDASEASYPLFPEARRALYVAVTRARHQLALACVGAKTPLLASRS